MSPKHEHRLDLRTNLLAVMHGTGSHEQIKSLVLFSHSLATAHLWKKFVCGRLNLGLIGLDIDDVGYDCIADLFVARENNSAIPLMSYFEELDVERSTEEELDDHFRHVIFSKVNQGIPRLYFDSNPTLGKIIRNVKLAIHKTRSFYEFDRFGETFLVPYFFKPALHLPVMTHEFLEEYLCTSIKCSRRIPDILLSLSTMVREQCEYAKAISLIETASAIRDAFASALDMNHTNGEDTIEREEIGNLIQRVHETVREEFLRKYVRTKKLTRKELIALASAVENYLTAIAIGQDGHLCSLFDSVSHYMPMISKDCYKGRYKSILEYMIHREKALLADTLLVH